MATLKQTTVDGNLLVGETFYLHDSLEIDTSRINFYNTKPTINIGQTAQNINLLGNWNGSSRLQLAGNYNKNGPSLILNSLLGNASADDNIGTLRFSGKDNLAASALLPVVDISARYVDSSNSYINISLADNGGTEMSDAIRIGKKDNAKPYIEFVKDSKTEYDIETDTTWAHNDPANYNLRLGSERTIPAEGKYFIYPYGNIAPSNTSQYARTDIVWDLDNASSITFDDSNYNYHFFEDTTTNSYGESVVMPQYRIANKDVKINGNLFLTHTGYTPSATLTSDAEITLYQSTNNYASGIKFRNRCIYHSNSADVLRFSTLSTHNGNNVVSEDIKGYVSASPNNLQMNFTGQHRVLAEISESLDELEGKIVVSKGNYRNLDSTNSVSINESLPIVCLSDKRSQKTVFGVVSSKEEKDVREHNLGAFCTVYSNNFEEEGRILVNSVGEGAIWVCNINGDFQNGDYITTCEIPGFGMKQEQQEMYNFTVAKITCECSFDLDSAFYECQEFEWEGVIYKKAFVGCTYHCG